MQAEKDRITLLKSYPAILQGTRCCFGGNQQWFPSKTVRDYGCGLIGAADVLWYLKDGREQKRNYGRQPERGQREYMEWAEALRRYFLIVPGFGMPGWFLSAGFNLYFRKYRMKYKAAWGTGKKDLIEEIRKQLETDIPVILGVGPHFPLFWKKEGLMMYRRETENLLKPVCRIRAHYVVITALCGETLEVSSWGEKYEIRIAEYQDYIEKYSNRLFCSICRIIPKEAGKRPALK